MRSLRGADLLVATGNAGKLAEFSALLEPFGTRLHSLKDLGLGEPEETEASFVGNALVKARAGARCWRRRVGPAPPPGARGCADARGKGCGGGGGGGGGGDGDGCQGTVCRRCFCSARQKRISLWKYIGQLFPRCHLAPLRAPSAAVYFQK
jgi:hypothetical protein